MKKQHTPGPWRVTQSAFLGDPTGISSVDGLHITNVSGYGATDETNQANARLIAAAPDLLNAAKLAIEWAEKFPSSYREWPHITAARSAIAKAIGN